MYVCMYVSKYVCLSVCLSGLSVCVCVFVCCQQVGSMRKQPWRGWFNHSQCAPIGGSSATTSVLRRILGDASWPEANSSSFLNVDSLVGGAITILKNMSSSMERIIPYMTWKLKFMFQTTNQKYVSDWEALVGGQGYSPAWDPPFDLRNGVKTTKKQSKVSRSKIHPGCSWFSVLVNNVLLVKIEGPGAG